MSYEQMAEKIKHDLDTELGFTFSLGLAPTKVLAKIASKWMKPSGLTVIPSSMAQHFLGMLPTEKVWGIGSNTSALLRKYGVITALDFASKDFEWVRSHLTKPHIEIWQELRGESVDPVSTGGKAILRLDPKSEDLHAPVKGREVCILPVIEKYRECVHQASAIQLSGNHRHSLYQDTRLPS